VGKKILVIKPSSLGDIANALAVVPQLRRIFPGSVIHWLANAEYAGFAALSGIERVIGFDRSSWRQWKGVFRGTKTFIALCRNLRSQRYNIVVDLQGLLRSGWFARVTGAPVRVGFADAREGAGFFYTDHVSVDRHNMHSVDCCLKAVEALGSVQKPVRWQWPGIDRYTAAVHEETGTRQGSYFVFVPGARWQTKQWNPLSYARVAAELYQEYRMPVYITGTAGEAQLTNRIVMKASQLSDGSNHIVSLAGKLDIIELAVLCRDARLVLSGDTGPMHMTDALSGRLLALMGPTNPIEHGPYLQPENVISVHLSCVPCHQRKCVKENIDCMDMITPEMVINRIRQICASENVTGENPDE
jgi:ADP-heptose:LPS heptosyltransferase